MIIRVSNIVVYIKVFKKRNKNATLLLMPAQKVCHLDNNISCSLIFYYKHCHRKMYLRHWRSKYGNTNADRNVLETMTAILNIISSFLVVIAMRATNAITQKPWQFDGPDNIASRSAFCVLFEPLSRLLLILSRASQISNLRVEKTCRKIIF